MFIIRTRAKLPFFLMILFSSYNMTTLLIFYFSNRKVLKLGAFIWYIAIQEQNTIRWERGCEGTWNRIWSYFYDLLILWIYMLSSILSFDRKLRYDLEYGGKC